MTKEAPQLDPAQLDQLAEIQADQSRDHIGEVIQPETPYDQAKAVDNSPVAEGSELMVVESVGHKKEVEPGRFANRREAESVTTDHSEKPDYSDPALKEMVKPLNVLHLKEAIDQQANKRIEEQKGRMFSVHDKDGSQAKAHKETAESIKNELLDEYLKTGDDTGERKVPASVRTQVDEMLKLPYGELELMLEAGEKGGQTPEKTPETQPPIVTKEEIEAEKEDEQKLVPYEQPPLSDEQIKRNQEERRLAKTQDVDKHIGELEATAERIRKRNLKLTRPDGEIRHPFAQKELDEAYQRLKTAKEYFNIAPPPPPTEAEPEKSAETTSVNARMISNKPTYGSVVSIAPESRRIKKSILGGRGGKVKVGDLRKGMEDRQVPAQGSLEGRLRRLEELQEEDKKSRKTLDDMEAIGDPGGKIAQDAKARLERNDQERYDVVHGIAEDRAADRFERDLERARIQASQDEAIEKINNLTQ